MQTYLSQKAKFFLASFILFFSFSSFLIASVSAAGVEPVLTTEQTVAATSTKAENFNITVDQATISKGYTVSAFNKIKLSLDQGTLNQATEVDVQKLDEPFDFPWSINDLSPVYQFEFKNKPAYNNQHSFNIELKYDQATNNLKQVFFYDKGYQSWRPLPSHDYPAEKMIRASIYLPFARIAVFEFPKLLESGQASWYSYKHGMFAASPDFPIGSKLRVFNADNPKLFVDVIINDFGPDRTTHPTRVLDIDKLAFAKLAPLNQGMINILIQPLSIIAKGNEVLGIPPHGLTAGLDITAKAAVVLNPETGAIIWSKLATTTLPIASLTKLVSMSVFLATKPDLAKVVTYSVADEEFNYQYANKWEVARLTVADGDTLTEENLLYSALVGSANNAVESLVRVSGLSRSAFINQMNQLVSSWGASSTKFIEPTGLSPQNVSSALDYATISSKALNNPTIEKISKTTSYKFTTLNTKTTHHLTNTNQLISSSKLAVTGSKTGYLDEAGYCLMTRANNGSNHQVIVVTLGASSRQASFAETEKLASYGLSKIQ